VYGEFYTGLRRTKFVSLPNRFDTTSLLYVLRLFEKTFVQSAEVVSCSLRHMCLKVQGLTIQVEGLANKSEYPLSQHVFKEQNDRIIGLSRVNICVQVILQILPRNNCARYREIIDVTSRYTCFANRQ
jgi:hypothetical protein